MVCSISLLILTASVLPSPQRTGTVEMGGLTAIQKLKIDRGCRGLNVFVGGFEMLCVLLGVEYH